MTNEEYNKKKQECLADLCKEHGFIKTADVKGIFGYAFDRAYALGKQEKDADKQEVFICEKSKVLYRFRMAEACKIGNNPESDYWIGYSKAIQDLFGLEGEPYLTPNDADTVIQGWVARDDGERWHERELHLFTRNKPEIRKLMGDWIGRPSMTLDSNLFPDLTWESEPLEVEIILKRKKNG